MSKQTKRGVVVIAPDGTEVTTTAIICPASKRRASSSIQQPRKQRDRSRSASRYIALERQLIIEPSSRQSSR